MARYANRILEIVCRKGEHLTAEQIFSELKQEQPAVVMATVYNNLNSLYEKGEIRRICVQGFADRYDGLERHDHFVCPKCGKLTDVDLPDLKTQLEKAAGSSIEDYDLRLIRCCEPQCMP